jgi:hypothetical protein
MSKAKYPPGYLLGAWWRQRRLRALDLASGRCQYAPRLDDYHGGFTAGDRCPETSHLEVHHTCQDRIGCELDEDLLVLCRWHHIAIEACTWLCPACGSEVFNDPEEVLELIDDIEIEELTLDSVVEEASSCEWLHLERLDSSGPLYIYCGGCAHFLTKHADKDA